MVGAAALAGDAALRSGAGLVTIGTPQSVYPILAAKVTCCTTQPFPQTAAGTFSDRGLRRISEVAQRFDVVALGPGLGRHPSTTRLVLRLAAGLARPMVIDADGLNALAERPAVLKGAAARRVVTPHPGEMARLVGSAPQAQVQADRRRVAEAFAREHGAVVVLKGYRSVVTDGDRTFINPTGNPGMASGGTGDVLTGVIAALLAQGLDPFQAAQAGTYVHGLAGDLAARALGQISLMASDLLDYLPTAFLRYAGLRGRGSGR